MGITFAFKQYIIIALAGVTIVYALILRAIAKEKENFKKQEFARQAPISQTSSEPKTIEDVVEMQEVKQETPVSPLKKSIHKTRKSKVLVKSTQEYE